MGHVGLSAAHAVLITGHGVTRGSIFDRNVISPEIKRFIFHVVHGPLGEIFVTRPSAAERTPLFTDDGA
jgi:hypothetical protein